MIIIFTGPGGSSASGVHMCPPPAGHLDYLRPQGLPVPHQPQLQLHSSDPSASYCWRRCMCIIMP